MKYPNITLGRVEAVWNKLGGEEGVEGFLRDKSGTTSAVAVEDQPWLGFVPENEARLSSGSGVYVDRSIRYPYPRWVRSLKNPELEHTGPNVYDLTKDVEVWCHEGQESWANGFVILNYLETNDMLGKHLGLADGIAIQRKGAKSVKKLLGRRAITLLLWRSVVQSWEAGLHCYVPYLDVTDGRARIGWVSLSASTSTANPGLRFST